MSIPLTKLVNDNYDPMVLDPEFIDLMEHYMYFIRSSSVVKVVSTITHDTYKYMGDFYGLLSIMGVPKQMHWITLRLNNLTNPCDFNTGISHLLIPDENFINGILEKYKKRVS